MNKDTLVVLWTSGDLEVAKNMVFMYTLNAKKKGWWENINFVIWGPSSKLLSDTPELQEKIQEFIREGIKVEACKACADNYGIADKLENLGVEVKYMGQPLTDYIKEGYSVLSF